MMNLKDALQEDIAAGIQAAIEACELELDDDKTPEIVVEHPDDVSHGDYASPIALALAKQAGMQPMDIVEIIAKHMPKKEYIGAVEAAKPGFLNIRLDTGWMTARLDDVVQQDLCSDVNVGQNRSVNLEFVSANPTGPLTLGNVRTAFSADTLGNVLECAGFNVTREYYINDAGGQIHRLGESVLRRILQEEGIDVEFSEDLYQGAYIKEIAHDIAERMKETDGKAFAAEDLEDEALLRRVSDEAKDAMLASIKETAENVLNIHFDVWTSEQELRDSGVVEEALEKLQQSEQVYEKEGAHYLRTSEHGDSEDRVLVKSDGDYAYIAPDVGYHQQKYDREFDVIFTFLGADHQGHVPKLEAAMKALGHDTSKLHFVVSQWMGLRKDGEPFSTSKRKGKLYGPDELIEEIGYDAARYFMVQHALTTHMELDLDLAAEKSERNPVYYVQYAYVRLQSILRKAKQAGVIEEVGDAVELTSDARLTHTAELDLLRMMYRWPESVSDIARTYDVHQLPYYAYELARAVHVFHRNVPVLPEEDEDVRRSRLQLVLAARKVLGQTLDLLGISKPDVM